MVPTNPDNSQPLIYRILDSLGVAHLVVPVNHTHTESEVTDLTTHLVNKLAKLTSFTTGNFVKVKSDGTLEDSGKKASDFQSPLTFDDTPTSGSNNPVKSGGILAAISNAVANKLAKLTSFTTGNFVKIKSDGTLEDSGKSASDFQSPLTFDSTPTENSTNPVTSGGVYAAIKNAIAPSIGITAVFYGTNTTTLTMSDGGNLPVGIFMSELKLRRHSSRKAAFVSSTTITVKYEIYSDSFVRIYYNDTLFAHKSGDTWTVDYPSVGLVELCPFYYPTPGSQWIELTPIDGGFNTGQKFYLVSDEPTGYQVWQAGSERAHSCITTLGSSNKANEFLNTNYDAWPDYYDMPSDAPYEVSAQS